MYYVGSLIVGEEHLCHHGVKGQKWGKRQFQYQDGSLTPLGREHYDVGEPESETRPTETKFTREYFSRKKPADKPKEEKKTGTASASASAGATSRKKSKKGKGGKGGKGGKVSKSKTGKRLRSAKIQARIDAVMKKRLSEIGG